MKFILIMALVIALLVVFTFVYSPLSTVDVTSLTNEYRNENGLDSLTYNSLLEQAARAHAYDIASLVGHTGSDGSQPHQRVEDTGYIWSSVSENIYISSFEPEPVNAVRGWKNSPGHNANLLREVSTETGVAKVYHEDQDTWVVVAVYAKP